MSQKGIRIVTFTSLLDILVPMATLLLAVLYFLAFQGLCCAYGAQLTELTATQGEMLVVKCDCLRPCTNITWTHHHPSESQRALWQSRGDSYGDDPWVHNGRLVVLRASWERQGNYSCFNYLGNSNTTCWFTLTVSPTRQEEDPDTKVCAKGTSCSLRHFCPKDLNAPSFNPLNRAVWHKDKNIQGDSFQGYFSEVAEKDEGVYTCRRTYQYRGRLYNHTSAVVLKVKTDPFRGRTPSILLPKPGDVYPVQLGSQLVVPCVLKVYNIFDTWYWSDGKSYVKADQNQSVYYNQTVETVGKERTINMSLVFQKVTEDQLSRNYTCRLESTQHSSKVSISLALKDLPVSSLMVAGLAVLFALLVVVSSGLVFFWCRVPFTLFLRDKLGCHSNASEGLGGAARGWGFQSLTRVPEAVD